MNKIENWQVDVQNTDANNNIPFKRIYIRTEVKTSKQVTRGDGKRERRGNE